MFVRCVEGEGEKELVEGRGVRRVPERRRTLMQGSWVVSLWIVRVAGLL